MRVNERYQNNFLKRNFNWKTMDSASNGCVHHHDHSNGTTASTNESDDKSFHSAGRRLLKWTQVLYSYCRLDFFLFSVYRSLGSSDKVKRVKESSSVVCCRLGAYPLEVQSVYSRWLPSAGHLDGLHQKFGLFSQRDSQYSDSRYVDFVSCLLLDLAHLHNLLSDPF